MPRICYQPKQFRRSSLELIEHANRIIADYAAQGFTLTVRQIYYQMVARGIVPNTQRMYKRLGSILASARLAGLVDWLAIEDRTRNLQRNPHWKSPSAMMEGAIEQYAIDKWATQPRRVEVWIEKQALSGVVAGVCAELDIAHFSCRGYTSASEMWRAAMRLRAYVKDGQDPLVLHFGDHDPSGVDMSRDIVERLEMLAQCPVEVTRVALNMAQVSRFNPPANPAKITDSRASGYISIYGYQSWELDALEPRIIVGLIRQETLAVRDEALWAEACATEDAHRASLQEATANIADVPTWPS
jgi:hypothetical protein